MQAVRQDSYRKAVRQLKEEKRERHAWEPCENYRLLVCQQAWQAWRALPNSVKVWISVDDMISHGMWVCYQYITKHFNSKRSNSITTGLQHILHNMYIHEYIETYGAWKRGWHRDELKNMYSVRIDSIESLREDSTEGNKFLEHISALVTSEDTILDNILTKCYVIPAMESIYQNASDKLKNEIVDWFWQRKQKVHLKSKPFQIAAKEFRSLADQQKLKCDDCIHLVRSPECLDTLSRTIFGIAYDNVCSPVVN